MINLLDWVLLNFTEKELNVYRQRKLAHRTLESLGKEMGVTRERIRQIEAKIEEKIRRAGLIIETNVEIKMIEND